MHTDYGKFGTLVIICYLSHLYKSYIMYLEHDRVGTILLISKIMLNTSMERVHLIYTANQKANTQIHKENCFLFTMKISLQFMNIPQTILVLNGIIYNSLCGF